MRVVLVAALSLLLVPGCYCSHLPDRFTFDDGGMDAGSDQPDAGGRHDSGDRSDAGPADAGCSTMCNGECTDTQVDPMHCGSCDRSCSAPDNGAPTCVGGVCGFACNPGYARVLGTCVELNAPRPLSPLSTATVTSRRPAFRWELAPRTDGARVQVCEDRACSSVLETIDATGTSVRVTDDLPPSAVVYWRLFSLADGVAGPSPSATWQIQVGARSADGDADLSWGTTLDVDGNGFADVAIGAPQFASPEDGAAYLYRGGLSGVGGTPERIQGDPGLNAEFGRAVTSAGDVNGDGFADIVIGAPGANSQDGAAFLFLGGAGSLGERRQTLRPPPGPLGGTFGLSVASAGDVNGDGYADVVIGAPGLSGGTVYVFHGDSTGLSATPHATLTEPDGLGGEFGWAVGTAGDVDGDGFGDIVVGAPRVNSNAGRAYVFYGSSSGIRPTDPTRRATLVGSGTERLGWAVAALDLDGNGLSDVAIGAPGAGSNVGAVRVYSGGPGGLAPSDPTRLLVINGSTPSQFFGTMVSSGGDLDGDGFADLAVGSPEAETAAGLVHVYGGGPAGADPLDDTRNAELTAPSSGAFGAGLGSGDIDGDGLSDLLVGAPGVSGSVGAVFVFRGGAGGVDFVRRQMLASPSSLPTFFGRSVASAAL